MANPIIPGIPQTEQDLLYSKLNAYNQGRASYKEVGAYLVVLPRPEHLQYTLWIYSPLPGRQSIFYICDLSTDIHETQQWQQARTKSLAATTVWTLTCLLHPITQSKSHRASIIPWVA